MGMSRARFLTPQEVADHLRVSSMTVYRLIKSGELRAVRVGKAYRLLEDLGVEFDPEIATCLYTGIFTDTGSFQYSNSSPATLRIAADLLEFETVLKVTKD